MLVRHGEIIARVIVVVIRIGMTLPTADLALGGLSLGVRLALAQL